MDSKSERRDQESHLMEGRGSTVSTLLNSKSTKVVTKTQENEVISGFTKTAAVKDQK